MREVDCDLKWNVTFNWRGQQMLYTSVSQGHEDVQAFIHMAEGLARK